MLQRKVQTERVERKYYVGETICQLIAINPDETILKEVFGENAKVESYLKKNDKNPSYPYMKVEALLGFDSKNPLNPTNIDSYVRKDMLLSNEDRIYSFDKITKYCDLIDDYNNVIKRVLFEEEESAEDMARKYYNEKVKSDPKFTQKFSSINNFIDLETVRIAKTGELGFVNFLTTEVYGLNKKDLQNYFKKRESIQLPSMERLQDEINTYFDDLNNGLYYGTGRLDSYKNTKVGYVLGIRYYAATNTQDNTSSINFVQTVIEHSYFSSVAKPKEKNFNVFNSLTGVWEKEDSNERITRASAEFLRFVLSKEGKVTGWLPLDNKDFSFREFDKDAYLADLLDTSDKVKEEEGEVEGDLPF